MTVLDPPPPPADTDDAAGDKGKGKGKWDKKDEKRKGKKGDTAEGDDGLAPYLNSSHLCVPV